MTVPTTTGAREELRLTESEWRLREEFRQHWSAFCDADPVPEEFADRMDDAGFIQLRKVTRYDLEDSFAQERGIEKGGYVWDLTRLGKEILDQASSAKESV